MSPNARSRYLVDEPVKPRTGGADVRKSSGLLAGEYGSLGRGGGRWKSESATHDRSVLAYVAKVLRRNEIYSLPIVGYDAGVSEAPLLCVPSAASTRLGCDAVTGY